MTEVIHIDLIKLSEQAPTEVTTSEIIISDLGLKYSARFYADEPIDSDDEAMGYKNVYNCFDVFARVEKIAGIEKSYSSKNKCWQIGIIVYGFQNYINLFFKKESAATEIFDKLYRWLNKL